MKTSTVGQLMIDKVLPEAMRGKQRLLDKQGLKEMMHELAVEHPDEYREVSHNLSRIGMRAAFTTGGNSFGLKHMLQSKSAVAERIKLKAAINNLLDNDDLDDDLRDQAIIKLTGRLAGTQQKTIYNESLEEENPLAYQVLSGSRGNPMNLASLRGSDLLYTDHRDRTLPVPILNSYSQGLSPLEYWAGAYGARKGVMDTKFATQDAGFLSKQLNQIVHRALVSQMDDDDEPTTTRGLPVDVSDDESEGSLLAYPVAGYKRNTVLTPKILQSLRARKIKRILVRSPAVGGPGDGGVYARDAGIREFGRLPEMGANIGMTAAQAMSEPLQQAQLSSKHAGGVAGASANQAVSGFDWINQMIQIPKQFKGGAAHADLDGLVQRIEEAPAGGQYVWIENQKHYVGKGYDLKVKRGDHVEAGDVLSDGAPNPSTVVKHKGIGEGRRYFINAFRQSFRDAGIKGHRRNIELLSKGLINHVRLTEEIGDYVPDDVVSYQQLERSWKPRPGAQLLAPGSAVGRYLEKPYLHYSIGTKIRPSMLKDFSDFGVAEIETHEDDPPFQPEMIRGMANLQHDPDWVTRMFGSGLKTGLLSGVHRGATSDPTGTSFVPGLARAVDFGRIGKVQSPKPWPKSKMACEAAALRLQLEKQAASPSPEALRYLIQAQYARQRKQKKTEGERTWRDTVGDALDWSIYGQARHIGEGGQQVDPNDRSQPTWVPPDTASQADKDKRYLPSVGDLPDSTAEYWFRQNPVGIPIPNFEGAFRTDAMVVNDYNQAIMEGRTPDAGLSEKARAIMEEKFPEQYRLGSTQHRMEVNGPEATMNEDWASMTPGQRKNQLVKMYAQSGTAPSRTWREITNEELAPPEFQVFYGDDKDKMRDLAGSSDAYSTVDGFNQYADKFTLNPEIRANLQKLPMNERIEIGKQLLILKGRVRSGEITEQQGVDELAALGTGTAQHAQTPPTDPGTGGQHLSATSTQQSPSGAPGTPQQPAPAQQPPLAQIAEPGAAHPAPPQYPVQQQPPQQPGLAGIPPASGASPPQANPQAQAKPTAGAPFTRRTKPWGLQMAQFAPGAVSSTIQNLGPAGIGAYGLLFNPGAVATLAAGPTGGKGGKPTPTPSVSSIMGGFKPPGNPQKSPTMKSKTMVPG